MGTAKVPPTGKKMVVGPQAYSVTFDANDKVTRQTGGYIADVRDGATGDAGAMWAVARAHRRTNAPRRRQTARVANWVGAKLKDFPKGRSHAADLPAAWTSRGRTKGLRSANAWTKYAARHPRSYRGHAPHLSSCSTVLLSTPC